MLQQLVDTANVYILGIGRNSMVNKWNDTTTETAIFTQGTYVLLFSKFIMPELCGSMQGVTDSTL